MSKIKVRKVQRLAWLGLLILLFSSWPGNKPIFGQENKTYISEKNNFSFQFPAAYEVKAAKDSLDFSKDNKIFFSLWVEDRFIEMLYQMLHPGIIMYRTGEDPYRDLAETTRRDKELFHRYALQMTKGWCSADGPDGSVYCEKLQSEKPFTSRGGFNCFELYPVMIREDFNSNTKAEKVVGPVFAIYLPQKELPVLLMMAPLQGELASPAVAREMGEIIDSLKVRQ